MYKYIMVSLKNLKKETIPNISIYMPKGPVALAVNANESLVGLRPNVKAKNLVLLKPSLRKEHNTPILFKYIKSICFAPIAAKAPISDRELMPLGKFALATDQLKQNSNIISYNFNKDLKIINSLSSLSSIAAKANSELKANNQLDKKNTKEVEKIITNASIALAPRDKNIRWFLSEDIQRLLISYFKSIFSLINKVKYNITSEKIKIEIFYYITIPDANIFNWYKIIYPNMSIGQNPISDKDEEESREVKVKTRVNNRSILKLRKKIKLLRRKNKSIRILKKVLPTVADKDKLLELNTNSINKVYSNKFNNLTNLLSNLFRKPVELDLIRLHHSDSESNILAQLFFLILKKKNIKGVINKLFSKNKIKDINYSNNISLSDANLKLSSYIPVFISGLYIHIGGRLMREPIIPRLTTKKYEKGAIALGKVHNLDKTQITKKNKKGAHTIKITYAQNII